MTEQEFKELLSEYQTLRHINVKLEEAMREVIKLKNPNTLDVQINRIRQEIDERATNTRRAASGTQSNNA